MGATQQISVIFWCFSPATCVYVLLALHQGQANIASWIFFTVMKIELMLDHRKEHYWLRTTAENTFSVLLFLGVECWLFEKGMYSSYSSQKYIVWILIIRTILWFFIKQIHLPSRCRNTNRHLVWKKAFLHLYTSTKIYILKPGNGCIPAIYC